MEALHGQVLSYFAIWKLTSWKTDHSAVKCFVNDPRCKLTLYLPCKWTGEKYEDIGVRDWKKNPGRTSNLYHEKFSNTIGYNSLQEIQKAASLGATLDTSFHGFHNRNSQVAKSDFLIAFTWSTSGAPDDGGTLDTWEKAKSAQKVHVSLCNVGSGVATSTSSMKRKQELTLQQEESVQKHVDNISVNSCTSDDKTEYAVDYVSESEYVALEKACKEAESLKRVKLDK